MGQDLRKDYDDFLKTKKKMREISQRQKIDGYDSESAGGGNKGCFAKIIIFVIIIGGIILAIATGMVDKIF